MKNILCNLTFKKGKFLYATYETDGNDNALTNLYFISKNWIFSNLCTLRKGYVNS